MDLVALDVPVIWRLCQSAACIEIYPLFPNNSKDIAARQIFSPLASSDANI